MAEPSTKQPEEMTYQELIATANEYKIDGRHNMKKDVLLAAVKEALAAPKPDGEGEQAEQGDGEPEIDGDNNTNPINDKPGDTQPPDPDSEAAALQAQNALLEQKLIDEANTKLREEQAAELAQKEIADRQREEKVAADRRAAHAEGRLTEEDKLQLMRATPEELELIESDAGSDPKYQFIVLGVKAEWERRAQLEKQTEARRLKQSPNAQYKITGGPANMRYVAPSAYVTQLPLGSIVSPLTHDLEHLQQQGFTWEKIKGVLVTEDQLGNLVSEAKT